MKPLEERGRPEKADNVRISPGESEYGNGASYLIRRLKRDRPDLAEKLARGEFKSARESPPGSARYLGLRKRERSREGL